MPTTRKIRAVWCAMGLFVSVLVLGCLAEDGGVNDKPRIEVRCGVDLGLTPESGIHEDWSGAIQSWMAVVEGDTVTLKRRRSCGDECSITEKIVLGGISGTCPVFVSASFTRSDAGGALGPTSTTTRSEEGTLEIQDWDSKSGIMSGRLDSEVKFTFYVSRAPAR